MACFRPVSASQLASGDIVFTERSGMEVIRSLSLPCGQCVGCCLERSRQWAVRCVHEGQMHKFNSFVTLTYADAPFSLDHRHFQLFAKRLRDRKGPFRFYMCGEYGDLTSRPHYHAILFGAWFEDRRYHAKSGSGERLYVSAELDDLWQRGFCSIGDVTFESAAYVARYVMKKRLTSGRSAKSVEIVDPDTGEIHVRAAEYSRMSLRPGIGASWLERFRSDVYPSGMVVARGVESRAPRYYDKLQDEVDPFVMEDLEYSRFLRGQAQSGDNTDARLKVREQVAAARVKQLKRSLT